MYIFKYTYLYIKDIWIEMRYSDTNVSPKGYMFQYFHALFDNYYYGMKF